MTTTSTNKNSLDLSHFEAWNKSFNGLFFLLNMRHPQKFKGWPLAESETYPFKPRLLWGSRTFFLSAWLELVAWLELAAWRNKGKTVPLLSVFMALPSMSAWRICFYPMWKSIAKTHVTSRCVATPPVRFLFFLPWRGFKMWLWIHGSEQSRRYVSKIKNASQLPTL